MAKSIKVNNFRSYINEVSDIATRLSMVRDVFGVLDELFEREGYQQTERFNEATAIIFVRRFPMMLNAYRLAHLQLHDLINELDNLELEAMELAAGS